MTPFISGVSFLCLFLHFNFRLIFDQYNSNFSQLLKFLLATFLHKCYHFTYSIWQKKQNKQKHVLVFWLKVVVFFKLCV